MYTLLILAGIPALWLIILILLSVGDTDEDWTGGWVGWIATTIVFTAIFFVTNFASDASQISDVEELRASQERIEIYQNKTNELTNAFEALLSEKYPDHETDIFDKISPDNIEIYFAKYPEIRSGETFINLTDKVLSLNDQLYEEKIYLSGLKQHIRYRLNNPWLFQSFITDLSPEFHTIVYNENQ